METNGPLMGVAGDAGLVSFPDQAQAPYRPDRRASDMYAHSVGTCDLIRHEKAGGLAPERWETAGDLDGWAERSKEPASGPGYMRRNEPLLDALRVHACR